MSDEINEKNCFVTGLEVDCLKQKLGVTDNIFHEHNVAGADLDTFGISNILAGPLEYRFAGPKKWEFPQYPLIRNFFEKTKKEDRLEKHRNYLMEILVDDDK